MTCGFWGCCCCCCCFFTMEPKLPTEAGLAFFIRFMLVVIVVVDVEGSVFKKPKKV